MFDRSVAPPFAQCTTWCASHQVDGRRHPGNVQPPSRIHSAFNIFGGQSLSVLPTSRISRGPEHHRDQRRIACQAPHGLRRQQVPGQRRPAPGPVAEAVEVHGHEQGCLVRHRHALGGCDAASHDLDERLAAPLVRAAQVGTAFRAGPRCGEGPAPLRGPPTLPGRGRPVLLDPVVIDGLGQRGLPLESVLANLELALAAVRGDDPRAQLPDLLGPQSAAMSTKPCSTVSRASSVSLGSSLPNSASATAAFPTLTLPERQRLRGSPSWAHGTPARPERAGPRAPRPAGQFSEDPVNR